MIVIKNATEAPASVAFLFGYAYTGVTPRRKARYSLVTVTIQVRRGAACYALTQQRRIFAPKRSFVRTPIACVRSFARLPEPLLFARRRLPAVCVEPFPSCGVGDKRVGGGV